MDERMKDVRRCNSLLLIALLIFGASALAMPQDVRFDLDNGLRVAIQPVPHTEKIALILLFEVGEDDDPPGKSGLGHFVEHVYVSAAAGRFGQRSVDDFIERYGAGWNAQTGADYTVFATVFAKEKLEAELAEAAARMGALEITQVDLDRERPRMLEEVENMFGGLPAIAITNRAREAVRPTLHGGRRGGLPEHIRAIDLDTVREHWRKYYKPVNARLVLCGAVDVSDASNMVRKHFGPLASGEKLPPRPKREPAPIPRDVKTYTVKPKVPGVERYACIAFPAPSPDSKHYAAFLLLVNRLWMRSNAAGFEVRVQYTPLDDPVFLALVAPVDKSENVEDVLARLEAFLNDVAKIPPSPGEVERTRKNFAMFLGTGPVSGDLIASNLYGAAFGLGRRDQMKVDSTRLVDKLNSLNELEWERAMNEVIRSDKTASVTIAPPAN